MTQPAKRAIPARSPVRPSGALGPHGPPHPQPAEVRAGLPPEGRATARVKTIWSFGAAGIALVVAALKDGLSAQK